MFNLNQCVHVHVPSDKNLRPHPNVSHQGDYGFDQIAGLELHSPNGDISTFLSRCLFAWLFGLFKKTDV